jgi:hypothetical protein
LLQLFHAVMLNIFDFTFFFFDGSVSATDNFFVSSTISSSCSGTYFSKFFPNSSISRTILSDAALELVFAMVGDEY